MNTKNPKLILPDIKNLHKIDVYLENGGYKAAQKALKMSSDDVIEEVKNIIAK